MEPMKPEVMLTQVADLPRMMRSQTAVFDQAIRKVLTPLEYLSLHRVYLVGDGDSYHASLAAEMAFENIAKITCEPLSAMRFLEYGADYIPSDFPNDTLMVGISASGKTQRVVQAIERAKNRSTNVRTVAFSGQADTPVMNMAERSVQLKIEDLGGSPGVRTYSATLLGLYLLAIRIGELKNRYTMDEANAMRAELASLADVVEASAAGFDKMARQLAAEFKNCQSFIYAGSGPSFGTAIFSAAKVIEATGIFAMGQDLEEWWHVERFCYPDDMPVFVIAPEGKGYWRAVEMAKTAKSMGRRIIAVVNEKDQELSALADYVFPVVGQVREEFSPLVYHSPADLFACYLAKEQGKFLFQSNRGLV